MSDVMPDWLWFVGLIVSVGLSSGIGAYVALRTIIHVIDKWMR